MEHKLTFYDYKNSLVYENYETNEKMTFHLSTPKGREKLKRHAKSIRNNCKSIVIVECVGRGHSMSVFDGIVEKSKK